MEGSVVESVLRWTLVTLSVGLLYVLFSLGLTLIFGFHQVVNFAHGAFYALGAFVGYYVYSATGNFAVALIVAVGGVMLLSALAERGLVSRLYKREPADNFLLTFALGLLLLGVIKLTAGQDIRYFPVPALLDGKVTVGALTITHYRIFFIAAAMAIIYLVHLLLTKTKIGIVIRAGTANRPAVEVLGINTKVYFALLFAIGSGLAALAAVLTAPLLSVHPGMGDDIILWAFVIVIIGGMGSFKGAVLGGLLIGLVHGLGGIFIGPYSLLVTFGLLILILLVRPEGLFGVRRA